MWIFALVLIQDARGWDFAASVLLTIMPRIRSRVVFLRPKEKKPGIDRLIISAKIEDASYGNI